jgi:hypothetical protein
MGSIGGERLSYKPVLCHIGYVRKEAVCMYMIPSGATAGVGQMRVGNETHQERGRRIFGIFLRKGKRRDRHRPGGTLSIWPGAQAWRWV